MNTQRYIMPVIIAAGLHGALVYFFSESKSPIICLKPEKPPVLADRPRIEMADPPEDTGEAGAGKADPLPSQVDIPRPATEDIFTINVTPSAESIKPVMTLPKNPSTSIGIGDENFDLSRNSRTIVVSGGLDRPPRATVRPAPNYPFAMRSSATNGSVTVEFVVDTAGRVVTADAVRWTQRDFVDPAVQAVLRWRFEPGTINGRRVNFRMAIPIEFIATN